MIELEIKRLELMAEYASSVVLNLGIKDLKGSDIYQPLLKCLMISTEQQGKLLSWCTCTRLDKSIDDRLVYIALAEWSEHYSSDDFNYYQGKKDINTCNSMIELKKKIRHMIKYPRKYINISH